VVLVEPVAVARECLGKDSDVLAYGFGDDIEVAGEVGSQRICREEGDGGSG